MEFEKLQSIIADTMNVDANTITPETKFVDDLGADSLDVFEIILAVEDEYGISIDDSAAEKIVTVEDAVNAIKNSVR